MAYHLSFEYLLFFSSVMSDFLLLKELYPLFLISVLFFYLSSSISSIYSLRGIPFVSVSSIRLLSPMIPKRTKIVMTLMLFRLRIPR